MKKVLKKLRSSAGESITETLISLLISTLALVMLAGALSAATGIVLKSRDKMDKYYTANENFVQRPESTQNRTLTLTITDNRELITTANVNYYVNKEFSKTPVIAYTSVKSDGNEENGTEDG